MIVILKGYEDIAQVDELKERLESTGSGVTLNYEGRLCAIELSGETGESRQLLEGSGLEYEIIDTGGGLKLTSRYKNLEGSVIDVAGVPVGGRNVAVIAGPCSIEGLDVILRIGAKVKGYGASMLRGGAFKPRTSP